MNRLKDFSLTIEIDAPIEVVWQEMIDWEKQSEWMLATRIYDDLTSPEGIGHRLKAFTGPLSKFNRVIGVMDSMVVSKWDPPRFCRVEHVGRIIRGYGTFTLTELPNSSVRFDWYEEIDAPNLILALIKPGVLVGVWISLRRFRSLVERAR